MFMYIYATGDSFADGSGMGDYLLDNYPGDIPVSDFNNSNLQIRMNWQAGVFNNPKFKLIRDTGRQLAWPSVLERLTGIGVINGGYLGSTITSIFLRLVSDFNIHGTPSKVFINIPNAFRIPIFIRDAVMLEDKLFSITTTSLELYSSNQQTLANAYWTEYTDEEIIIFYLKDVLLIENYVKEKTGEFPVWIDSMFLDTIRQIVQDSTLPLTKLLWSQCHLSDVWSMASVLDNSDTYTADGHYGKTVHKKTAAAILHRYLT